VTVCMAYRASGLGLFKEAADRFPDPDVIVNRPNLRLITLGASQTRVESDV